MIGLALLAAGPYHGDAHKSDVAQQPLAPGCAARFRPP